MAARVYQVYSGFGAGSGWIPGGGSRGGKYASFIVTKNEGGAYLDLLEKYGRSYMLRAARHVGFRMQADIKTAIKNGFSGGIAIPNRKVLDSKGVRRISQKANAADYNKGISASKGKSFSMMMAYMKRKTKRFMGGGNKSRSLLQAVGYQKMPNGVVVGFLSKSSPLWASAVQAGRKGWGLGRMEHMMSQTITPRQRRFFAAIGLPTKKSVITQPRANFFEPFVRSRTLWIRNVLERRMKLYLMRAEKEAKLLGNVA